ncbi:hypothetical protein, partial [Modestobacter versicolor]|uniref:hypothetical protein n=1 Tax=Modestobacter versicolor TaxID=429133 RepID=UPI001C645B79
MLRSGAEVRPGHPPQQSAPCVPPPRTECREPLTPPGAAACARISGMPAADAVPATRGRTLADRYRRF